MKTITDILKESGWTLGQNPFTEKASHGATYYFSYQNRKNNELGLAIFENENLIRFRVFDLMSKEVSYLQIQIDEQINQIIQTISDKKDEITQSETFGFYFEISSMGEISILAWEQFEDDYV